jgi:4-amino-4-deoxy-L-arabinose transferase-like glycosyltransferase
MIPLPPTGRVPLPRALPLVGLLVGAVLLFGLGIGSYPITDGDAAYYGRVARNVLDGHALLLRFDPDNPAVDVDKPPLAIWLYAASIGLLGRSEFAARVWHLLLAVGLVWLTAEFARWGFNRRAGYLAGAVLATTCQFFYQAHEPILDVPLTLCVTGALYLVARFASAVRWSLFYAAWTAVAAGVMVKGPLAIVLTVVPACVLLRGSPDARRVPARTWVAHAVAGAALLALLVLPWHVWAVLHDGRAFLDVYAGAMSWQRYLKPLYPIGSGLPVYAAFLLLGTVPWTGFAIEALVTGRQNPDDRHAVRVLLAWVATVVLFFGLSPGMMIMRYLLPALPPLCMLAGRHLASAGAGSLRRAGWITVMLGASLVVAAWATAGTDAGRVGGVALLALLLMLAATSLAGGWAAVRGRAGLASACLLAGAVTAYVVFMLQVPVLVERLYPQREIARRINRECGAAARVATLRIGSVDLTMLAFYLDGRIKDLDTGAALRAVLDREPGVWVVEDQAHRLPDDVRGRLVEVARYPGRTLFRRGAP